MSFCGGFFWIPIFLQGTLTLYDASVAVLKLEGVIKS
jgi:hypothetical protein